MEQQNQKQTKKRGGWKLSAKTRKRIGDARRGLRLSEETKQKIKEAWTTEKRIKASSLHSGEKNHFFGKTWTPEHRAKIKESREKTAVSWSPEKKERIAKRYEAINSPRSFCQECGKITRRHNQTGMCREHRGLSQTLKEKIKQKYHDNKEERRRRANSYNANPKHKKRKQTYDIEYRKRNAKKIDTRVYEWRKERMKRDPLFKFKERLKTRVYSAFRSIGMKKPKRSFAILNGNLEQIKNHIESQFTEGMTWENYGKWHADHIIPIFLGKTKEEMVKLCHYNNLQPLWAIDNLRKGKKLQIKTRP